VIAVTFLAELERLKVFREAFLTLLLQDPHVIRPLDQWGRDEGLWDATRAMAAAVDEETVSRGVRATACALERLDTFIGDMAILISGELHLPYAGVGVALYQELCERAYATIYGDAPLLAHTLQACISDPPAPRFRLKSFQTKPGVLLWKISSFL
jgi:hypothetical protein